MADSSRQRRTGELSTFSTLPNELLLAICSLLSDTDLLALCRTSGSFNDLTLSVFFSRHARIQAAAISFDSASTPAIPLALSFLDRFDRLSCAFDHATAEADILRLTRLVSRLPRIREVEVNLVPLAQPPRMIGLAKLFLGLLFALIPDKSSTLVVLHHFTISISRRRRVYPRLEDLLPTIEIGNTCVLIAAIILYLASQKCLDLWTICSDPFQRKRQKDRIREDLHLDSSTTSIRVTRPFLPNPRSSKWTLIGINQSHMTGLSIPSNPQLPAILPAITLPALTHLTIDNKALLPFKSFVEFLMRHPSLSSLTLQNYSVTYTDLTPLPPHSLLHLRRLMAPPRHIVNILRDSSAAGAEGWPNMSDVGFPPVAPRTLGEFGYRIDPNVRFEPFDFGEFDDALQVVAHLKPANRLCLRLQIPAGTASLLWLDSSMQRYGRPETNLRHVSSLVLRPQQYRPFDPHLLSLLPKWLGLFPGVKDVTFSQDLAPTQDARETLSMEAKKALPNAMVWILCLV